MVVGLLVIPGGIGFLVAVVFPGVILLVVVDVVFLVVEVTMVLDGVQLGGMKPSRQSQVPSCLQNP